MKLSAIIKAGMAGVLALVASAIFGTANAATINLSKCVATLNKTMSDGATVTFWVFGPDGMMCSGALPGAAVEVGVGDTLNLTLNINGMTPQEAAPYNGHTIHLHGADVKISEDGVPETGAAVNGDTYTWVPTAEMAGSYNLPLSCAHSETSGNGHVRRAHCPAQGRHRQFPEPDHGRCRHGV